jgi:hypothetical protein
MTQDQTGQARDPGYARGEVIAHEAEGFPDEQPKPMTRFQKVTSALRGDSPDRDDPDVAAREQLVQDEPVFDPEAPRHVVPASETASGPDVMTPDAGAGASAPLAREMAGERGPDDVAEQDPSMTRSDMYGSADTDTGAIRTPYQDQADQAGTEAGYGSQVGTAGSYASQPGTTPGYGIRTGSGPGYGTEAGTVADSGSRDVTAMDPLGQAGTGSAVTGVSTAKPATGRHAAGAAEAGLRPGEATDRLGDFSDIAFGNLLPDADQYPTQWQRIQFRFVDDPQGSVTAAADIVSQVTGKLEAAIQERQRAIDERQRAIQERARALRGRWGEGSQADTETLRETLRMYRVFMDQLIGPTA